jgi:hypothetical protein
VVFGVQETQFEESPEDTGVKEHRAVSTARKANGDAVFERFGLVTREC